MNKLELVKGNLEGKKLHIENLEREIRMEANYLQEQAAKGDFNWVNNVSKRIQDLCTQLEKEKAIYKEMKEVLDFLSQ